MSGWIYNYFHHDVNRTRRNVFLIFPYHSSQWLRISLRCSPIGKEWGGGAQELVHLNTKTKYPPSPPPSTAINSSLRIQTWMSSPRLPRANKAEAIYLTWNASFPLKSISGDSLDHIQTHIPKQLVSHLKVFPELFLTNKGPRHQRLKDNKYNSLL